MNTTLFKTRLKTLLEARTSKNPKETADAFGNAYDQANKSLAFTMFGQKFVSGDKDKLISYLKSGFEKNQEIKTSNKELEHGWIQIARGFIWYWFESKFQDAPPPPGVSPAPNAVKVLSPFLWADRIKLANRIKLCFTEGSAQVNVDRLIWVLTEHHKTIKGTYIGVTPTGLPSPPIPWVGIIGEKPSEPGKKKDLIKTIRVSDWTKITTPDGYTVRFIDGLWRGNIKGQYAARFDSSGNMIIPSVNKTALENGGQINGRLSPELLVQIAGEPGLLEKTAGNAYLKMKQDAQKDGVSITFNSIISGYRPLGKRGDLKLKNDKNKKHFTQWSQREDYNECLFDNGWNEKSTNEQKKKAEQLCARDFAMPTFDNYGTSNHGWGRSVDIGSKDNPKLEAQKWIRENGWKYGWYWGEQPDEEWHFTWVLSGFVPPNLPIGTYYIRNSNGEIDPSNE